MRFLLPITTLLLFVLAAAPSASAQKAVQAWYHVSGADDARMVQARRVQVVTHNGVSQIVAGDARFGLRGAAEVTFYGTGARPEEQPEPSTRGGSSTRETTTTITEADGTKTTTTTVERQDERGDISTVSTTTTTSSPNGETTTTTVTYGND